MTLRSVGACVVLLLLAGCPADVSNGEGPTCTPNPCQAPHRAACSVVAEQVTCSCDPGTVDDGAGACVAAPTCAPNPCTAPHRASCSVVGQQAVCACDPGYADDGAGACVVVPACTPNPCTAANRGVCAVTGGAATCSCNAGFHDDGAGACVLDASCSPNPCTAPHQDVCAIANGAAVCSCSAGYHAGAGGVCVVDDPCRPVNPCTAAHQGVCSSVNGASSCLCDPGWTKDGSGACTQELAPGCGLAHTTGDFFEPDECPALAHSAFFVSEMHTIAPAADVDWSSFTGSADLAYQVRVTASGFAPVLLVYGPDGVDLLAQDAPTSGGVATVVVRPGALKTLVKVRASTATVTGSYTLAITYLGADAVGNRPADATPLTVGPSTSGSLEYAGDHDWFSFAAQAAHIYRVTVTGTVPVVASLWDQANALAPAGTNLDGSAATPAVMTDKLAAGLYFVRVRAATASNTGTYTVKVEDLGLDDHGDTAASATLMPLATTTAGALQFSGDHDWFAFDAVATHVYEVLVTGGTVSLVSSLWDVAGAADPVVNTPLDGQAGATARFVTRAPASAKLLLRVRAGTSTDLGTYGVRVNDLGVDDHGDSAAQATPLTLGATKPGVLETDTDADWFSWPVVAGHIYRVDVTPAGSLVKAQLIDADGTSVITSDWWNAAFSLRRLAAANGTGYVAVTVSAGSAGSYGVKVVDLGLDDHGNTPATATPLTLGVSRGGEVQLQGDVDAFSFAATKLHVYRVTVTSAAVLPAVRLVAPDGVTALVNQNGGSSVSFFHTIATTGTHTLIVSDSVGSSLGTFTILVEDMMTDDHGNLPSTATPLTLGATGLAGDIQYAADADWFRFTGSSSVTYTLTLGGTLASRATLYEANGTGAWEFLSGPGQRTLTLPFGGTWYVQVMATSSIGTGAYTVSLTP